MASPEVRETSWGSNRTLYDYNYDQLLVTVSLAEYRELVRKAALWDSEHRLVVSADD